MARVWPNLHVEPANLTVHVAALRRLLGDGKNGNRYLINIPGRGYRFVAGVTHSKKQSIPAELVIKSCANNLPAQVMRLVGRDETVAMIAAQLGKERFLTIVGPGGIGKSSVALAVAEQVVERFDDGVWQIDLARLNDASQIFGAIASALRSSGACGETVSSLVEFLRNKRILFVLDNCEHLVEAAASVVTTILRYVPGARVLATSRESLRSDGEHRYRLPSLGVPSGSRSPSPAEALRFSAVELFVRCATAKLENFELKDDDVLLVVGLCRRLDGMPLAIEFAASLIDTLGICGIMQHLEDGLHALTGGYRTAPPRHKTLRSMLDWSYDLLTERERMILRRLSILKGDFTLEQATIVTACNDVEPFDITDSVGSLVAKSLISADVSGKRVSYRLLETTKAYALEKLRESGDSYLPQVDAPAEKALQRMGLEASASGQGNCVLVVEDDEDVGRFSTELLKDLGYEIDLVGSADAALKALADNALAYDLVFSDVIMPGMNGVDLAVAIRERHPGLPVVLTSGYSSVLAQNADRGFELIQKPYSVEALSRILRKAISEKRSAIKE